MDSKKNRQCTRGDFFLQSYHQDQWDVINYLQEQIQSQAGVGNSFWFNLSTLLPCQLIVLRESQKLLGYAFISGLQAVDEGSAAASAVIEAFEVCTPFRKMGNADWLLAKVETVLKIQYKWSVVKLQPSNGAASFWTKMGYTDNGVTWQKRIAEEQQS